MSPLRLLSSIAALALCALLAVGAGGCSSGGGPDLQKACDTSKTATQAAMHFEARYAANPATVHIASKIAEARAAWQPAGDAICMLAGDPTAGGDLDDVSSTIRTALSAARAVIMTISEDDERFSALAALDATELGLILAGVLLGEPTPTPPTPEPA